MKRFLKWGAIGMLAWRLFGPRLQPSFAPPQEHPFRLPGHTVFVGDDEFLVRELGSGEGRPVLLIHGLSGATLTEWYQVAPKLAVDRRVIMVDHRGHGLSARGDQRYEIEDVADDLAGVLDQLGVGTVDVVGYSMGGLVAQALVFRHPDRTGRLVLMATFASHPQEDKWLRRLGAFFTRAWERVAGFGTPEVRSAYLIRTGAIDRRNARWLWRETQRRDVESGAQATFALLRFDSRPWIGKLGVETLVIVPTRDFLVPPRWQYEMASLLPGSRLVEVGGAGHELVWTHADRVVDELRAFL